MWFLMTGILLLHLLTSMTNPLPTGRTYLWKRACMCPPMICQPCLLIYMMIGLLTPNAKSSIAISSVRTALVTFNIHHRSTLWVPSRLLPFWLHSQALRLQREGIHLLCPPHPTGSVFVKSAISATCSGPIMGSDAIVSEPAAILALAVSSLSSLSQALHHTNQFRVQYRNDSIFL